jgi:hypothetical protein
MALFLLSDGCFFILQSIYSLFYLRMQYAVDVASNGERFTLANAANLKTLKTYIQAKLTKKSHKGSGSDIQCSDKFRRFK